MATKVMGHNGAGYTKVGWRAKDGTIHRSKLRAERHEKAGPEGVAKLGDDLWRQAKNEKERGEDI